ncbi:uncharacterized protein MYCFIDRAFT_84160 [Pseudocercospora fijiensis CIRAD86]|uniref:SnoaL-like domain-containing protein n=1 Tax=Pseudocercospora fijiensis (strain CIRAD86) TaxID=383855 RepID=M2Z212_PSEFD|nr:uncharacterized protein MYCFIDRAFT_84160 [Pseudocercospora fijiensis CIRAD86]EME83855.1 hypothetical protein MYCFIDRAFT_84160 [Pseudocercospora fijiensis CIRAD86]
MSYPTKPAFVHYGDWDDETRQHEAMKFMEDYTHAFDANSIPSQSLPKVRANNLEKDLLVRSTGQTDQGGEASLAALKNEIYAPFAAYHHEPSFIVAFETEQGWEMIGIATLWWNLAVPGDGPKQKDGKGKEWEGGVPAAFKFGYRKTGDGIKMSETRIMADPSGALVDMVKRGMVKPEQIFG